MANQKTSTKPELRAVNGNANKLEGRVDRPSFQVLENETVIEGRARKPGVYYFGFDKNGNPIDVRACDPLRVTCEVVDREGKHSLLLEFTERTADKGDVLKEHLIPKSLLRGLGERAVGELFDQGLGFDDSPGAEKYVVKYIKQNAKPPKVARVTDQPGWNPGNCFALPGRVIGSRNVIYRKGGNDDEVYDRKGTLEGWQNSVAALCVGNPTLILSVCCALAGPLLAKVGIVGGGIHAYGGSSGGKSGLADAAGSVWGRPKSFVGSWDATKNGIEIHMYKRNHTVAVMDEISRVNPKQLSGIIYMACNGGGKTSMTQEREGRPLLTWETLILSNGEKKVAEHAALAGDAINAGAELRMIDVDAGNRKYKAFDDDHGKGGREFRDELDRGTKNHYGSAGPAFVESLIKDSEALDLTERFRFFKEQFKAPSPQAGRVSDRFAVMAMAGEMAIEYDVLPWSPGTAIEGCQIIFDEWLAMAGSGNAEDRQILTSLSEYLDTYGDSKFADCTYQNPSNVGSQELSGYYQMEAGRRIYMLYAAALKKAVPGFGPARVCLALKEAGALLTHSDGRNQKVVTIPGRGQVRLYTIDYEKVQKALEEN
jgi:uncharacterized protein (DUF927 family)